MNRLVLGITISRWLTIIGGFGSLLTELGAYLGAVNPKLAHILASIGIFITMTNERIHGGASTV